MHRASIFGSACIRLNLSRLRSRRVQSRLLQVPGGLVRAGLRLPHGGRGGRAGAGAKQALDTTAHRDAGFARPGTRRHPPPPAHLGVQAAHRLQRALDAVQDRTVSAKGMRRLWHPWQDGRLPSCFPRPTPQANCPRAARLASSAALIKGTQRCLLITRGILWSLGCMS